MRLLLLAAVVAVVAGCGMRRVPNKILEKLPYEAKIELLESENDLALAVDRQDEAHAEVARTRDQIRRAKDREKAAGGEVGNAQDALSKDVAELAVKEAEMRVHWLRSKQQLNVKEEELADKNLDCAFTRYEQAKLAAARKAKLEGSESLDPNAFDQQVKDCDTEYTELRTKLKESNAAADEVRAEWDKARAALAKKTFDARASPFVE